MAAELYYNPFVPAFSNTGVAIAQAKLYFYYTETLTLAPIYSDGDLTVPLTNPVQANLAGKYPDIYLDADVVYRVRQTDKSDAPIMDDVDPYIPGQTWLSSSIVGNSDNLIFIQSGTGAVVRTAQDKMREIVSVKDFGALGDGTTIDVEKFNTAVAAVSAGQTLFFPAGDYIFDNSDTQGPLSTLTLPEGVNILMDGGAWLKRKPGGTHNIQAFITCGGNNILQVNIDADEYPGSMTGTWASDSWGIYGTDAANVTVINSNFRNMAYGIRPVGARNWKIVNCDFYRMKQSAVMFIADADSPAVGNIVQGNTFEDMGDTAVAFLPAVDAEVSFNLVANNIIKNTQHRTLGCSIDWEGGFAFGFIHDNACIGNTILHSVATTQGQGGITMGLYSSNGLISGNILRCAFDITDGTSADTGVFIPRCADILVEGNRIEGFRGGAIQQDGGFRNSIIRNKILNCGDGTGGGGLRAPILAAFLESSYGLLVADNDMAWDAGFPLAGSVFAAILGYCATGVGVVLDNTVISGNRLINPPWHGIRMVGNAGGNQPTHLIIKGNVIQGRATEFGNGNPISALDCTGPIICDNDISEVLFGIDVSGASDPVVRGNSIVNKDIATALGYWVKVTGVTGLRMSGNHFDTAVSVKLDPLSQLTTAVNDNKAWNNVGFVTENGGTTAAGVATGGTIAHGLDVTPNSFTAVATDAAATITQIAPGASNLTLTFTGGGTPVFAWSARYI